MCGICGTINIGNEDRLQKMVDLIKHRGPDDQGTIFLKSKNHRVYFGNTRLSVIDLSDLGHMPMQTEEGRFTITYNGECYNFQKIRQKLLDRGYRFRSATDTEVILKAYAHWGYEAVNLFDGMFAIAIWDNLEEELILMRDRAGIKPLYYYHNSDTFAFASEIKCLLELDEIKREPNLNSLILMAGFFWAPDPYTAFNSIFRLPPAHYLVFKNNNVIIKRYWKPQFQPNYYNSINEAVEDFDLIFKNSIKDHLISDVPVGAFVGGLDSSLIGILSQQHYNNQFPFYTSTIAPEAKKREDAPDDLPFVQQLIKNRDIPLYVHSMSKDTATYLPKLIWHLDEPSADPCAIQTYLMSKLARNNGCKVLLSGQGADELFLGYDRHRAVIYANKIQNVLPKSIISGINGLLSPLPVAIGDRGISCLRKSKRFFKSASYDPLQAFVYIYLVPPIEDLKKVSKLWSDRVDESVDFMIHKHKLFWNEINSGDTRDKMSYTDTLLYLSSYILFFSDKSSAAASIETRFPFLNKDVMEFAFRIPSKWKIQNNTVKYILRKMSERYLPADISYRKKVAFPGALRSWTRADWAENIQNLLLKNKSGFWDIPYLRNLVNRNKSGRNDYAHFLWALTRIEIWHNIFIDKLNYNDIDFI